MHTNHDSFPSPQYSDENSAVLSSAFRQLTPDDVEQFYTYYQHWQLQQRIQDTQTQIAELQQQINENADLMEMVRPSAIALSALAQLQSQGVQNIDLLDRMLERGDTWLDHTLQLLEYCERLDFIHDNYTEWCEHALEGAYDWVASIHDTPDAPESSSLEVETSTSIDATDRVDATDVTETLLLQKLMSDDETEKSPVAVADAEPHQEDISLVNDRVDSVVSDSATGVVQSPNEQAQEEQAVLPIRETTIAAGQLDEGSDAQDEPQSVVENKVEAHTAGRPTPPQQEESTGATTTDEVPTHRQHGFFRRLLAKVFQY